MILELRILIGIRLERLIGIVGIAHATALRGGGTALISAAFPRDGVA